MDEFDETFELVEKCDADDLPALPIEKEVSVDASSERPLQQNAEVVSPHVKEEPPVSIEPESGDLPKATDAEENAPDTFQEQPESSLGTEVLELLLFLLFLSFFWAAAVSQEVKKNGVRGLIKALRQPEVVLTPLTAKSNAAVSDWLPVTLRACKAAAAAARPLASAAHSYIVCNVVTPTREYVAYATAAAKAAQRPHESPPTGASLEMQKLALHADFAAKFAAVCWRDAHSTASACYCRIRVATQQADPYVQQLWDEAQPLWTAVKNKDTDALAKAFKTGYSKGAVLANGAAKTAEGYFFQFVETEVGAVVIFLALFIATVGLVTSLIIVMVSAP